MAVSLVTVAEVRSFLQKQDEDTEQDAILAALIERASEAVLTYTEREFAPVSATNTARQFYYPDNGVLSLTPYDLNTLVSVKIDTVDGAGGTTLGATEYRLMPKPAKDGVYNWLKLNPVTGNPTGTRFNDREVTVTGTWGFPAVPDDVKHWTSVTVADWFRLNVAAFSTTFNLDEGRVDIPQALPAAVRAGLARYRTPV